MLKTIIVLTLISALLADRLEVLVFRGLIAMMTCQFDTSPSSINGQNGISLKDCQHSPEAEEFQESIENLTYKDETNSSTMIPFRFLEKFTLKTTHYLGAIIQSNFRCTKTGDEFMVTLAFGYCKNDLNIGDFKNIKDNLENARSQQNAKIQECRKNVKTEGGKSIANKNTLDELNDEHLEATKRKEELTKKNEELINEINNKEKMLETEEGEAVGLEEMCEECLGQLKIKMGNMHTLETEIESLEREIRCVQNQIDKNKAADVTEEYNVSIETLNQSLNDIKIFNPKMTLPNARKGVKYNHEDLTCLY